MKNIYNRFLKLFAKKQWLTREQQKAVEEVSYDKAKEILKEEEEKLDNIKKKLENNLSVIFKEHIEIY